MDTGSGSVAIAALRRERAALVQRLEALEGPRREIAKITDAIADIDNALRTLQPAGDIDAAPNS